VTEVNALKVLFIASLSHSGSTLLDLMLNAHPDMVSVGELKQLGRFARFAKKKKAHRCTCGAESVWECSLWSGVSILTERAIGRRIDQLNVEDYKDRQTFDQDNVALFEAIATTAGKQFVIDSSKSRIRLKLLMANKALTVFPIFLLRDPKGQICSSLKKARNRHLFGELVSDYVVTNREIYNTIKHHPHGIVRYEQLVQDPVGTLGPILQQLGVAFHPRQLDWAVQERHNVGGNHMRWGTSSELELDEVWRRKFTRAQKLAIDIGTLPGRFPLLKMGLPNLPLRADAAKAEERRRLTEGVSRLAQRSDSSAE
jgi:Sulfotransferase family